MLQKSIEIGKQIEEIQSRTKKEIKTTLKEKAQESPEKIWNNSIRRIQLLTRKYS
ncbi:hypothetical protein KKG31_01740 [Patescibacteria group bacterium]|nr:hypothetical protein [Patescibacteria group bacterium]MBU1757895.1 hypothetical protein [Patescibacteria group bacterium]